MKLIIGMEITFDVLQSCAARWGLAGDRGEGEGKAAGGRDGWGLGRAVGNLGSRQVRA